MMIVYAREIRIFSYCKKKNNTIIIIIIKNMMMRITANVMQWHEQLNWNACWSNFRFRGKNLIKSWNLCHMFIVQWGEVSIKHVFAYSNVQKKTNNSLKLVKKFKFQHSEVLMSEIVSAICQTFLIHSMPLRIH